ncbi:MAG: GNAT family N-acetyltransferase [Alphaproteobacteria bacterium]|nr:GNAT family N-acetyltransferase [Alphaproteobacteria bacterium]
MGNVIVAASPEFERASADDVALMVEWAAREGWNPGLRDIDAFRAADPDGFWIARVDGTPAACMSLVTYDPSFAFLGFYIAHPDYRGRSIGFALWQHALAACRADTIGLDGVVDQQDNYRKSGFVLAHRNIRYGGVPARSTGSKDGLTAITPEHLDAIAAYDAGLFPAGRTAFLEKWLGTDGHTGLVAQSGSRIGGFGVVRPCREGHKIGPLFADDADTAERLFDGLTAQVPDGPVFLDPPEPNGPACRLAERRGLAPVFETARMYRGPAPGLPLERIFGITTFELG